MPTSNGCARNGNFISKTVVVKALFDTNILIDFLRGVKAAKAEIKRYPDKAISIITWMEVQTGVAPEDQMAVDGFLANFAILQVDGPVSKRAVELRKGKTITPPDAIVWASAQVHQRLLVTRNTKDFASSDPGVRVPYRV